MDNNEEITVVERNPLTMGAMVEQDTACHAIDEVIALLDTPTAFNDGFPFLCEPTHLTRFPAVFK